MSIAIIVQKYGGSSVSSPDAIKKVAALIKERVETGKRLCVVVSAMGKTTDQLLQQAALISKSPSRRELDMLLTCGERASMALLAMALGELGVPCVSLTGSQSGIITDTVHAGAKIVEMKPSRVLAELNDGKVVIVAGFQGVSIDKEITTLGRGGSDTTAVALAAALNAEACEIFSDVAGVYTADPRLVPDAQLLEAIDYDLMTEMAKSGAKVMNEQAVKIAKQKGIVIHALKTGDSGSGTKIGIADASQAPVITVTHLEKVVVATVRSKKALQELLKVMADNRLNIQSLSGSGPFVIVISGDRLSQVEELFRGVIDLELQIASAVAILTTRAETIPLLTAQAIAQEEDFISLYSVPQGLGLVIHPHKMEAMVARFHNYFIPP